MHKKKLVVPKNGYVAYPSNKPDNIQKYFVYDRKYDAMRYPNGNECPAVFDTEAYLDYEPEIKTSVRGYLLGVLGAVGLGIALVISIC